MKIKSNSEVPETRKFHRRMTQDQRISAVKEAAYADKDIKLKALRDSGEILLWIIF